MIFSSGGGEREDEDNRWHEDGQTWIFFHHYPFGAYINKINTLCFWFMDQPKL